MRALDRLILAGTGLTLFACPALCGAAIWAGRVPDTPNTWTLVAVLFVLACIGTGTQAHIINVEAP
jgi:hypothetical protein